MEVMNTFQPCTTEMKPAFDWLMYEESMSWTCSTHHCLLMMAQAKFTPAGTVRVFLSRLLSMY